MAEPKPPICVLTVAGSDSGGGAGIQADQRTITALGGFALTAVTAVTAQDTRRVTAWKALSPELIGAQIGTSLEGFAVASVKIGLMPGTGAILATVAALSRLPSLPIVIDPVIASSGGTRFLSASGVLTLKRKLFPLAALVTPNWPEAEELTRTRVRTHEEAERAARLLAAECGRAVLVKGGHATGGACRDCLSLANGAVTWFENPRVRTANTHGTGCVLSSAIAVGIGRGADLVDAIRRARSFLQASLIAGRSKKWKGGHGPAFH